MDETPPTNVDACLGRVIAARRRELKITQEALADRTGLHSTYISQLERGLKSPTVRVLESIAKALSANGADLLRDAEALE